MDPRIIELYDDYTHRPFERRVFIERLAALAGGSAAAMALLPFHNDTAGARYDKAAAELAWSRTMAFFKRTLG